jgi:hypothetical protein
MLYITLNGVLNSDLMTDNNRRDYQRPNPVRRRGVFLGGYFDKAVREAVEREARLTTEGNVSLAMRDLLLEALEAREAKRRE